MDRYQETRDGVSFAVFLDNGGHWHLEVEDAYWLYHMAASREWAEQEARGRGCSKDWETGFYRPDVFGPALVAAVCELGMEWLAGRPGIDLVIPYNRKRVKDDVHKRPGVLPAVEP